VGGLHLPRSLWPATAAASPDSAGAFPSPISWLTHLGSATVFSLPRWRRQRWDWSDVPFFDRGATPGTYKNQDTLLAGLVLYFSAKE